MEKAREIRQGSAMLVDGFQRRITYLRLSVTDRCDLRCAYCMPERMKFLPRAEVLSLEELHRLALAFIERGGDDDPVDRGRAAGAARCHGPCSGDWAQAG